MVVESERGVRPEVKYTHNCNQTELVIINWHAQDTTHFIAQYIFLVVINI
jgi:hypothetical protein